MKYFVGLTVMVALATTTLPLTEVSAQSNVRSKYTKCLRDFANKHLDMKTTVSAFEAAVSNTCEKDKLAAWEETRKDEIKYDSSAEEAKKFADEDIQEILRLLKEQYAVMQVDNMKFVD